MFIDTANLSQIKEMLQFNQFERVTTNLGCCLRKASRVLNSRLQIRA